MRSIRFRLTAAYTAVILLTFLLLGGVTWVLVRTHLLAALRQDLAHRCHALAEEVTDSDGRPVLPDAHTAFEGPHSGYALLDRDGRPVLNEGLSLADFPQTLAFLLRQPRGLGQESGWWWRAEPILVGGHRLGTVLAAHQPREVDDTLSQLARVLLALLPGVTVVSASLGWLLAGRALAPVSRLAGQVGDIGATDLHRRLPVPGDELGSLARSFNDMLSRLESAFDRQRRFTADASHELRTPLATILAASSQKLMRPREPEEYARGLQEIHGAALSMSGLLDSLLFLARSDARAQPLEWESLRLEELLDGLRDEFQFEVEGGATVKGDLTLLTRLFSNLLENARIHGRARQVRVSLRAQAGWAVVQVVDDGVGVAPEHLPSLLERFYQVDRSRHSRGAGLGLSICLSIAAAHGGDIQVASAREGGLAVTVRLPAP